MECAEPEAVARQLLTLFSQYHADDTCIKHLRGVRTLLAKQRYCENICAWRPDPREVANAHFTQQCAKAMEQIAGKMEEGRWTLLPSITGQHVEECLRALKDIPAGGMSGQVMQTEQPWASKGTLVGFEGLIMLLIILIFVAIGCYSMQHPPGYARGDL